MDPFKGINKETKVIFSNLLTSGRRNCLFLTWKSDSSWKTAYIDSWACLESANLKFWISFFVFLAVILVPELFKKLRETPGNNFHQVSSKSDPGCPSNLMLSHVNMRSWGGIWSPDFKLGKCDRIFPGSGVGTCRIWTKLGGNCSQESPGAF